MAAMEGSRNVSNRVRLELNHPIDDSLGLVGWKSWLANWIGQSVGSIGWKDTLYKANKSYDMNWDIWREL